MGKCPTLCRFAALLCLWSTSGQAALPIVTVGGNGNEPLIASAPDGTLYIAALQYIYRSTDAGATWTQLLGPDIAATVLASDSSISVDPAGRLYMSFDYPYAGSTAVCTSDNRGDSWSCNPAVVPGGTDRMWVTTPKSDEAYVVTNEGLYQTAFLMSTDGGANWIPTQFADGELSPGTGPLLQKHGGGDVLQAVELYDPNDDTGHLAVYVFKPGIPATVLSDTRHTPLPYLNALPSGAFDLDNNLYLVSETPNAANGRRLVVARSADEGQNWTTLPELPESAAGTVTFAWLAAGKAGHVGVIYYYSAASSDPAAMPADAGWSVKWAESFDAASADPHWTVMTLENIPHQGVICAAADCMGDNRFAGDFINAVFDSQDRAQLTWMSEDDKQVTFVRYLAAPVGLPVAGGGGGGGPQPQSHDPITGSGSPAPASLAWLVLAALARRRRLGPE